MEMPSLDLMSYATRIDEMIGKHVAEFQAELTLAKKLKQYLVDPTMPYGYPVAVYRPIHVCRTPQVKQFIHHTGGKLSNNVPKVLGMEMDEEYPLGIYNQHFGDKNLSSQSERV